MEAALNVGAIGLIIVAQSFHYRVGLLRRRRTIKVDKRVPVNLLVKTREVRPDLGDVKGTGNHSVRTRHLAA
jgi:hypothetical protein